MYPALPLYDERAGPKSTLVHRPFAEIDRFQSDSAARLSAKSVFCAHSAGTDGDNQVNKSLLF